MGFFGDLWDSFSDKGVEKNPQKGSAGAVHGPMGGPYYVQDDKQFHDSYKNALGMGTPEDPVKANAGYFNNPHIGVT